MYLPRPKNFWQASGPGIPHDEIPFAFFVEDDKEGRSYTIVGWKRYRKHLKKYAIFGSIVEINNKRIEPFHGTVIVMGIEGRRVEGPISIEVM